MDGRGLAKKRWGNIWRKYVEFYSVDAFALVLSASSLSMRPLLWSSFAPVYRPFDSCLLIFSSDFLIPSLVIIPLVRPPRKPTMIL